MNEALENLKQAEELLMEMMKESHNPVRLEKTLATIRETIKILESGQSKTKKPVSSTRL